MRNRAVSVRDLSVGGTTRADLHVLPRWPPHTVLLALATLRTHVDLPGPICLFTHTDPLAHADLHARVIFSVRVRLYAHADSPKRSDLPSCADVHMLVPAITHTGLPSPCCFRACVGLRTRFLLPPHNNLCT
eukprot:316581-Pleurochrysis_carterae.AAC.1